MGSAIDGRGAASHHPYDDGYPHVDYDHDLPIVLCQLPQPRP
jgi:hypothetical protein